VICKYSKNFIIIIIFCIKYSYIFFFSVIKLECCGFKEKNEPQKIFNQIDFCNNVNQTRSLCDEKLKNDFHQNLIAIIVIYTILTIFGALACILAIYLACTTSNTTQHATFQSRYH